MDHIKCIQSAEVLYRDYRTFQVYINGGLFFPQLSSNHELITERWGPDLISDPKNREQLFQFINSSPKLGSIYIRPSPPLYAHQHHQTMRNTSMANHIYEFGQTYVGIGYVDLFQIAWGHYKESISDKILTFYGYDSSWVTVLRSKIIYCAMKYYTEEQITTRSLLQIWFSSCWDKETSDSFDMLIKDAVADPERFQLDIEKDVPILQKWQEVTITKEESVEEFSKDIDEFNDIWHMKINIDRVKFFRYLFTGCIFVDEKMIVCGNKTMFADVCGTTKKPGELFFKAIDLSANGFKSGRKTDSLYDNIIRVTHNIIFGFRSFVRMGKIVCILQRKVIDPIKELEFADTIKALKPYSIDWSSLPDYFEKNSFMRFAEACSVESTLHTVHFLEWDKYVFGACHVDWLEFQDKYLEIYYKSKMAVNAKHQTLQSLGTKSLLFFFEYSPFINHLDELNMYLAKAFRKPFGDFFLSDNQGNVLPRFENDEWDFPGLLFFEHSYYVIRSTFSFNKGTTIKQPFMTSLYF